jgi:hypothetical protein
LDLHERLDAIQAQSRFGSASAWLPRGCSEAFGMLLPDNDNQAARDAFA